MAEVIESVLDTQEKRDVVPASPKSEINSEAAKEEAEKAGASQSEPNKHEEKERKLIDHADNSKLDKLDELSSLEQEIAKMHNIQHSSESDHSESEMAGQVKDTGSGGNAANGSGHNDSRIMDELAQVTRCTPDAVDNNVDDTKSAATLEEVDLIALLKGTDQDQQENPINSAQPVVEHNSSIELALAKLDNVGVTIEGEGQYEIMEIDDGDNASGPSPVLQTANQPATNPVTKYGSTQGKQKLSPEQARAVALEQMADLKSHTARRKMAAAAAANSTSIRQQPQKPLDIISSLNDDWNEYDSESDTPSNSNSNSNSNSIAPPPASKKTTPKAKPMPAQSAENSGTEVMSVKVLVKSITQKSLENLKSSPSTERANSNPESTGNINLNILLIYRILSSSNDFRLQAHARYKTQNHLGSRCARDAKIICAICKWQRNSNSNSNSNRSNSNNSDGDGDHQLGSQKGASLNAKG